MKRINIVVEGQTEEDFVKEILEQPFAHQMIYLAARQVETGRKQGKTYKGGATSYLKIRRDILNWLRQDHQAISTMMFDLYALPNDFPAFAEASQQPDPYQRVEMLEAAVLADIMSEIDGTPDRFIPYIQLHEFEGLLFSEPASLSSWLSLNNPSPTLAADLQAILDQAQGNPELINDDPRTAPSKRILSLCGDYNKPLLGILIAETIGLPTLREKCRHFNQWLTRLESITDFQSLNEDLPEADSSTKEHP